MQFAADPGARSNVGARGSTAWDADVLCREPLSPTSHSIGVLQVGPPARPSGLRGGSVKGQRCRRWPHTVAPVVVDRRTAVAAVRRSW